MEYSRQQKHNRKRKMADDIIGTLSLCEMNGFKPKSIELEDTDSGKYEMLDIVNGSFSKKENLTSDKVHSVLYVKDKFSISNQAFHELSMVTPGLPRSSEVRKLVQTMNSEFEIYPSSNKIVGVQQCL